jgi:precorrin-6Y C5,15-methyltransferase (decarboxylating)
MFFGIGRKLTQSFPDQKIVVYPVLSSMQLAFARFNIPWDDTVFVSLHGRSNRALAVRLLNHAKTFILTDPVNSPDSIARKLLAECGEKAVSDFKIYVAEHLGFDSERLFSGNLTQIASQKFADPNVMIFTNFVAEMLPYPSFGLQEHEICHSRGLLTKNEVRAAAIHALRLPQKGIFWDVGAGSGSVGLEAARLFPELQVLAIEKKDEQWQNITANKNKFAVWNLSIIQGEAPVALQHLDKPDRVFIGGSGGNLKEILECCTEKLEENGIIVVNAVISTTAKIAPEILHILGFDVEIREIAVQRYSYPKGEIKKFNPIKIIVGQKKSLQESGNEQ